MVDGRRMTNKSPNQAQKKRKRNETKQNTHTHTVNGKQKLAHSCLLTTIDTLFSFFPPLFSGFRSFIDSVGSVESIFTLIMMTFFSNNIFFLKAIRKTDNILFETFCFISFSSISIYCVPFLLFATIKCNKTNKIRTFSFFFH